MTFASLFSRYQIGLEASLKGSDLIFDCTDLLHYESHNIDLKRGRSYIDSPDEIKNKKVQ